MESDAENIKTSFLHPTFRIYGRYITSFPNNLDLKTGKTFIIGLTKVSKKLIGIWKTSVVDIYEEAIMNGDKEYFINKDYSEDLGEGEQIK